MTSTYWLGVIFAFIVLLGIFFRMRNQGMKERYATWWLVIAIAVAVISVFHSVLEGTAHLVGVKVPLNLAFFLAGVIMLLLSLRFSVDLSQSDEERRRLAEEIAFLRAEIDSLKSEPRTRREDSPTDPSR